MTPTTALAALFALALAPGAVSAAPLSAAPFEELVGEAVAYRKVALCFKLNGRVDRVAKFAGDVVAAGEEVARLDDRDFRASLAQAEAALEALRARLRMQETGARPQERQAAVEQLRQAEATAVNTRADLQRNRDLFTAGAVSRQVLDAAEAKATVAEAQFQTCMQQKALVDLGPRAEEVQATRAQVRQAEASLNLARLQLEYASLRAPFAGAVAQRHLDEGSTVTNTTAVLSLVQIDPIFVSVDCPERLLPSLRAGLAATVAIDALPGQAFHGTLPRAPALVDTRTRTARVELVVENPSGAIKPGMFARARLVAVEASGGAR